MTNVDFGTIIVTEQNDWEEKWMNNIANDIHNAYCEGYEQGRFDGVMDATNGMAALTGYDVVAVVKCKNCEYWTKMSDSAQGNCLLNGNYPTGEWYCANGQVRESLYKTE